MEWSATKAAAGDTKKPPADVTALIEELLSSGNRAGKSKAAEVGGTFRPKTTYICGFKRYDGIWREVKISVLRHIIVTISVN